MESNLHRDERVAESDVILSKAAQSSIDKSFATYSAVRSKHAQATQGASDESDEQISTAVSELRNQYTESEYELRVAQDTQARTLPIFDQWNQSNMTSNDRNLDVAALDAHRSLVEPDSLTRASLEVLQKLWTGRELQLELRQHPFLREVTQAAVREAVASKEAVLKTEAQAQSERAQHDHSGLQRQVDEAKQRIAEMQQRQDAMVGKDLYRDVHASLAQTRHEADGLRVKLDDACGERDQAKEELESLRENCKTREQDVTRDMASLRSNVQTLSKWLGPSDMAVADRLELWGATAPAIKLVQSHSWHAELHSTKWPLFVTGASTSPRAPAYSLVDRVTCLAVDKDRDQTAFADELQGLVQSLRHELPQDIVRACVPLCFAYKTLVSELASSHSCELWMWLNVLRLAECLLTMRNTYTFETLRSSHLELYNGFDTCLRPNSRAAVWLFDGIYEVIKRTQSVVEAHAPPPDSIVYSKIPILDENIPEPEGRGVDYEETVDGKHYLFSDGPSTICVLDKAARKITLYKRTECTRLVAESAHDLNLARIQCRWGTQAPTVYKVPRGSLFVRKHGLQIPEHIMAAIMSPEQCAENLQRARDANRFWQEARERLHS